MEKRGEIISADLIWNFEEGIKQLTLPNQFTFPFYYEPHKLSEMAVAQLKKYLSDQNDFEHNFGLNPNQEGLVIGKMFGVLVVEDVNGQLGFFGIKAAKKSLQVGRIYFSEFLSFFVKTFKEQDNKLFCFIYKGL